jgi:hypothetical protein
LTLESRRRLLASVMSAAAKPSVKVVIHIA